MTTSVIYPTDGSTAQFAVPFPYLDRLHVKVRLDDVELPTTDFVWETAGSIVLNTIPAAGRKLKISRETPSEGLTTYQAGSTLTSEELEIDSLQALYRLEEIEADSDASLKLADPQRGIVDPTLPAPIPLNLLGWSNDGTRVENFEPDSFAAAATAGITYRYPVTAGQTTINLSALPTPFAIQSVFYRGIYQEQPAYSLSGGVLTFSEPLPEDGAVAIVAVFASPGSPADASALGYTGPEANSISRPLRDRVRERYVSVFDFIPLSEQAAIVAGTSTYDAAPKIQAAIDSLVARKGGIVFFPAGVYNVKSTIIVSQSHTSLIGEGGGHTRSGTPNLRASALTRISWDPTVIPAAGTPVVLFAIPAASLAVSGGGIADLMIDGNAVAPVGLTVRSWNQARFDRLAVYACTEDQVLMETANYAIAAGNVGASQYNTFSQCYVSTFGGTGWYLTNTARGFRLKGGSSFNTGDSSINTFIGCLAYMSLGTGYMIENVGQDCFVNCWGAPAFLMTTPVNGVHTVTGTGGTLAAGTYYYRVQAYNANTGEISTASVENSVVVASGTTNRVQVNWSAVAGATHYFVYGRTTGAEQLIATVAAATTYNDTGAVTPSGAIQAQRKAFGVILGSSDQATNTGTAGPARHHSFQFCEMNVWARASQLGGGQASFGNMFHSLSNGDAQLAPITIESPTNNTDAATITYTTSGAKLGNTPALGFFGEVRVDQSFGNTAVAGPFMYLDRRVAGAAGLPVGEIRWLVRDANGVNPVSAGRFAATMNFNTLGAEMVTMRIFPMYNGADTQSAMEWRNGVTVPDGVTSVTMQGYGKVNVSVGYWIGNTQVVTARKPGWTAATGTATRSTFATASVTLPVLAEHVKALIDDLIAHGLIGT